MDATLRFVVADQIAERGGGWHTPIAQEWPSVTTPFALRSSVIARIVFLGVSGGLAGLLYLWTPLRAYVLAIVDRLFVAVLECTQWFLIAIAAVRADRPIGLALLPILAFALLPAWAKGHSFLVEHLKRTSYPNIAEQYFLFSSVENAPPRPPIAARLTSIVQWIIPSNAPIYSEAALALVRAFENPALDGMSATDRTRSALEDYRTRIDEICDPYGPCVESAVLVLHEARFMWYLSDQGTRVQYATTAKALADSAQMILRPVRIAGKKRDLIDAVASNTFGAHAIGEFNALRKEALLASRVPGIAESTGAWVDSLAFKLERARYLFKSALRDTATLNLPKSFQDRVHNNLVDVTVHLFHMSRDPKNVTKLRAHSGLATMLESFGSATQFEAQLRQDIRLLSMASLDSSGSYQYCLTIAQAAGLGALTCGADDVSVWQDAQVQFLARGLTHAHPAEIRKTPSLFYFDSTTVWRAGAVAHLLDGGSLNVGTR